MAQRRERPPAQRSGQTIGVRLPGGRTVSVPTSSSRGPAEPDVCCFCGEPVGHAERVELDARWVAESEERHRSLSAHRSCLLDRLHERVRGPSFADG
jgi:ribosomal protein L34E